MAILVEKSAATVVGLLTNPSLNEIQMHRDSYQKYSTSAAREVDDGWVMEMAELDLTPASSFVLLVAGRFLRGFVGLAVRRREVAAEFPREVGGLVAGEDLKEIPLGT